MKTKIEYTLDYVLLLDLETTLKDGQICIDKHGNISQFPDLSSIGLGYSKDEIHKVLAYKKLNQDARDFDLPFLPEWEEYPVYDMAEDMTRKHPDFNSEGWSEYQNGRLNGIIDGFNKAIELNKDKLFTIQDVKQALTSLAIEAGSSDGLVDINSPASMFVWMENHLNWLQQSKMPKDFIPDTNTCIFCGCNKSSCEKIKICCYKGEYFELKTINTSLGKQVIGKWVF